MKKHMSNPENDEVDDILPEYDFTGKKGVRGKYYQAYGQGHTVKIHQEDGAVSIQYFTLEDGAVMLEPDVRAYFPTSASVNKALRALIEIMPEKPVNRVAENQSPEKDYDA
jgi:hypothetical protein